ncbi:AAA family ATPase [Eoetvoesiella caeni]
MSTNVVSHKLKDLFNLKDVPESQTITAFADSTNPFIPIKDERFVFRKEFVRDMRAFLFKPEGDALYITGPTGSGKTSGVTQMAARLNWPVQQITAHGHMELSDLVGYHALISPRPGETPVMQFMYGPLARAMREGHILLINEIDLADPAEIAGLNDILEGRPLVIAQNGGEIIQPHPTFRVVVTGNSVGSGDATGFYQGVQVQNLASLDRYRFLFVDYTEDHVEKSIIERAYPKLHGQVVDNMIAVAKRIRELFIGGKSADSQLSVTMSTRTLLRWAKLTMQFHGAPNAAALALDQALLIRTVDEERAAILRITKDVFGDLWK